MNDKTYTCTCGQKAKMPMCFDCFKKGLERQQLLTRDNLSLKLVLSVYAVMFIVGPLAWWFKF